MRPEYDIVVIGAGAAGLTASGMSALLGAKTALIEQARLGGECTWTGCIPSKTLLHAASVAHTLRTAGEFAGRGDSAAHGEPLRPSFERAMERVRSVQQRIYDDADAPPNMEKLGVTVIPETAEFIDPHTIQAGSHRITSKRFIIATGSRPRTLRLDCAVLTADTLWGLSTLPGRLAIAGAGPVAIEMAQAFRRLGSQVTVIAPGDGILPRDDRELTSMLQAELEREGVRFVPGTKVFTGRVLGGKTVLGLENGSQIECDAVLAAIGREPNLHGVHLDKAGVRWSEKGVEIDARCRTSQRHIYAIGDVTGRHQFTHMAEHMAKVAVTNAVLRWPAKVDERHVTWCTFTEPELGQTGIPAHELKGSHRVFRFPFSRLDRAITEGRTTGMVKVSTDTSGRILGASILGARAGELLAAYSVAMRNGVRLADVSNTIHAYPTFSLANRRAADQWSMSYLDSPILKVVKRVLGHRGVLKGSGVL